MLLFTRHITTNLSTSMFYVLITVSWIDRCLQPRSTYVWTYTVHTKVGGSRLLSQLNLLTN